MKRLSIILVCFATMAFTSCSIFGSAASSNTAAQTMGQTCGSAILGLYNSYKATGSVSLTYGNNLTNALALATCYTQIKANASNSSYRNAFATGLVMSSAGLITNQNSNAFINALLMCSGLANVSSSNSTQQNQQATTTATTTLFQAVNKK
jgi:hypothetical protein